MSVINSSPVSRPFVVSAVILLFIGSGIGAIWAMSLNGIFVFQELRTLVSLHKELQLDGFITLLIMGIGYMIVPRFRNMQLPLKKLVYLSYVLIISSIAISFIQGISGNNFNFSLLRHGFQISGILIFSAITLWLIKTPPKLLRKADYFITISIVTFVSFYVAELASALFFQVGTTNLLRIQGWLLFPILMIFGVEYKTLPSFLGFIRPKRRLGSISVIFAALSSMIAIMSLFFYQPIMSLIFGMFLLGSAGSLALSLYVFGGFDNAKVRQLFQGEKEKRYQLTQLLTRLSFILLFGGILFTVGHYIVPGKFAFYDLAIHYTAIGFIGLSIMLYLPLMLPPIINKTIHFVNFNKTPLVLILISLAMRTVNDFVVVGNVVQTTPLKFLGLYGWVILAGMFAFVIMVHKSMRSPKSQLEMI